MQFYIYIQCPAKSLSLVEIVFLVAQGHWRHNIICCYVILVAISLWGHYLTEADRRKIEALSCGYLGKCWEIS